MSHQERVTPRTEVAPNTSAHLARQIRDGQRLARAKGAVPGSGWERVLTARYLLELGWTAPPGSCPVARCIRGRGHPGGHDLADDVPESATPFTDRYETVVEQTSTGLVLIFIALLVLNAARAVADGVHGLADWLAALSLVLAAGLVVLFARVLLLRWRRRKAGRR